jgi:hypothetical protein
LCLFARARLSDLLSPPASLLSFPLCFCPFSLPPVQIVSGALQDLFDTCALFCRSLSTPNPSTIERLTSDWTRQSCFLFSVLSRKTDFTGGSSSFLHALVSRLDFNGHFTAVSSQLGLGRASKQQMVPITKGTVISTQEIQRKMGEDPAASRLVYATRAPPSTDGPASSSASSSYPSQAHLFSQANTRPTYASGSSSSASTTRPPYSGSTSSRPYERTQY